MKALLILLIAIILIIFGYNKYSDYERFRLENYAYKSLNEEAIDGVKSEAALVYFQKIEELNGHVITQWSAHHIDVRNPKNDDAQTLAARATYDRLLGEIKFLENHIQNQKVPVIDKEALHNQKRRDRIKELFHATPNNVLRIGSKGPLVYEIQKLLNAGGSEIPEDGNFQTATFEALQLFESSQNLLPDGKLDLLTLEHLLDK